jgi:predicted acylesterase/phospholipase RssA
MRKAHCYEQYAAAGYMLDREEGNDKWKQDEKSPHYDYPLIKAKLEVMRSSRKTGDDLTMMFNLRTTISRNIGDIGNQQLYEHTHIGTKVLIEEYIDEVTKQLNYICDIDLPSFNLRDKLDYFLNIQKSFGRTALLLSGGATFGLTHIGVVKTLFDAKLLPKVISGSSAGSIMASVLASRTDEEIAIIMNPKWMNIDVFEDVNDHHISFVKLRRFLTHGVFLDIKVFIAAMRQNIGDYTFQEAYNRTRRILNITVSSSTNYEMPRLLNYLTAPNVLIWSAVAASCALPTIYRSSPLIAKDKFGVFVAWNPSGSQFEDGSIEGDLPMQRLSELFGVNHFIVAQANPYILPFVNSKPGTRSRFSQSCQKVGMVILTELQHRMGQIIELGLSPNIMKKAYSIMGQKYYGHITITPDIPWKNYSEILANPTISMVNNFMVLGERATWPSIII